MNYYAIAILILIIFAIVFYPKKPDLNKLTRDVLRERVDLDLIEQTRQIEIYPANAFCPSDPNTSGTCTDGYFLTYFSLMNSLVFIKDSTTFFDDESKFYFDTDENFIKGIQAELGDSYIVTIYNLTAVNINIYPFSFPPISMQPEDIIHLKLLVTAVNDSYSNLGYKVSVAKLI
jgi:hypothetical protein